MTVLFGHGHGIIIHYQVLVLEMVSESVSKILDKVLFTSRITFL